MNDHKSLKEILAREDVKEGLTWLIILLIGFMLGSMYAMNGGRKYKVVARISDNRISGEIDLNWDELPENCMGEIVLIGRAYTLRFTPESVFVFSPTENVAGLENV